MSIFANARFATLLAIALALLLSGVVAGAAGGYLVIGSANQAGVSNTSLDTTSSGFAWQMYQHGTGVGVFGISDDGVALAGLANNGNQYALSVTNAGAAGTGAAIIADGRNNTAADFRVNLNSIPPMKVNSTGKVTNLNADLLDGLDSTAIARVARASSDATQQILSGGGATTVLQVTINVPSGAQFVEVTGEFAAWDFGNTQCPCEVDYRLQEAGTSNFSSFGLTFVQSTDGSGGVNSISWVFPASPGDHTYNLVVQTYDNSTDSITVGYKRLIARTVIAGASGGSTLGSLETFSSQPSGPASEPRR